MKKYFQAPWSLKDIGIITGSIILLTAIVLGILYFLPFRISANTPKSLYVLIIFLLQWVLIFAPLLFWTHRKHHLKWGNFGFEKIGILKALGFIISAYFLYLGINFIISIIIIYWNLKIPGFQIQESIFELFGKDIFSIIMSGIMVVLIAPFVEEIFFRGFLLRTMCNKAGNIFGSVITAVVFTLLHFPWQSFIPIFILGLIINSVVIKSKSIWPAIGFHILNNGTAFTILLLMEKGIISLDKL